MVTTACRVQALGGTYGRVAGARGVSPAALISWRRQLSSGALAPRPRGRPPTRSPRPARQALLDDLKENGFHQAIDALRRRHTTLAKREVADLVRRARNVRSRRGAPRRKEEWSRPGVLWSVDHTFEGKGPDAILVVRDVASRANLLAWRVPDKSLPWVVVALTLLFQKHGAPLVVRMDGGFVGKELFAFLAEAGVRAWVTRPASPWENGSVERANGDLKARVTGLCEARGLPESERVLLFPEARVQSNTRVHPRAFQGRTPQQVWENREKIQPHERAALAERFNHHFESERKRLRRDEAESKIDRESERRALERALCDLGLLVVRSVRITPPISTQRCGRISGA